MGCSLETTPLEGFTFINQVRSTCHYLGEQALNATLEKAQGKAESSPCHNALRSARAKAQDMLASHCPVLAAAPPTGTSRHHRARPQPAGSSSSPADCRRGGGARESYQFFTPGLGNSHLAVAKAHGVKEMEGVREGTDEPRDMPVL